MTNIEKALLSLTFPQGDMKLLEEVIDATPSSSVATEILCGIYLEPTMPCTVWKDKEKSVCYTKESYDKWKDQVNYSYMVPKTIGTGYFSKDVKTEDINETNWKELKLDSSHENVRYLAIVSTTEKEKSTSTMDLERWCKLCPVDMTELPIAEFESSRKCIKPSDIEVTAG
jgi:hypothetical protein